MEPNPFQPPKAELDAGAPIEIAATDGPMPGTVIAVIVLVAVEAALALVSFSFVSAVVCGVVIVGFARRHALAWQWGIVLPTLGIVLLALVLWAMGDHPPALFVLVIVGGMALQAAIPVLLSFRASKIFFGLQCPKCGAVRVRAASFMFTKRKCRACDFVWTPVRK
jgi:hypothetical protein